MRSTRAEQDAAALDDFGGALEEVGVPYARSTRRARDPCRLADCSR